MEMGSRFEKPKMPVDVILSSKDGMVTWQIKYDNGSVSQEEMTQISTASKDAALAFKKRKLMELGLEEGSEKAA